MERIENEINLRLSRGENLVCATVLSSEGSTPRSAGARMIFLGDESFLGTIGGGLIEAEVIRLAKKAFSSKDAVISSFDLRDAKTLSSLDMICGGKMTVLIEYLAATDENIRFFNQFCDETGNKDAFALIKLGESLNHRLPPLRRTYVAKEDIVPDLPRDLTDSFRQKINRHSNTALIKEQNQWFVLEPAAIPACTFIFGAGHVSMQVAKMASMVGFKTVVLDDRAEFANTLRFKNADKVIVVDSYKKAFTSLDINENSYIVILTRGHLHDKTVLAEALKTTAGYIGMIGSRRKRDTIYKSLYGKGYTAEDIQRVHCPIGISIQAETPEEIAVSIVAELICLKNK